MQDRKGDTGETASGIQRKVGAAMPLSRGRKPHPLTRGEGVDRLQMQVGGQAICF